MKRCITLFLCLLLLLALGCTEIPLPKQDGEPTSAPVTDKDMESYPVSVGKLSFDTVTLDGKQIRAGVVSDYDLVIVNCWAEWCGPCVRELPELERIHREFPNVLILGVLSFSNDVEGAKETLSDKGVTYPAFEPAGSLTELVNQFDAIPATMFFDRNGKQIADPIVGSRNYSEWKAIVEGLLP